MRYLIILILVWASACAHGDDWTPPEKPDPQAILQEARNDTDAKRFETALAKLVWFHENALSIRPSLYGVRLSFALADWVKLGKRYPKALVTLKGIRDEKTSRLLAGEANTDLFNDVESINHHLGESKATVDLFKKLEVARPEFAASIYDLADEALIGAREYGLAKKYLADPMTRFADAKCRFEKGMQYAKTSRTGDVSRRAFESIFTDEVVRIITVLDKTGESDQAREIQAKALIILESPVIKNAIRQ